MSSGVPFITGLVPLDHEEGRPHQLPAPSSTWHPFFREPQSCGGGMGELLSPNETQLLTSRMVQASAFFFSGPSLDMCVGRGQTRGTGWWKGRQPNPLHVPENKGPLGTLGFCERVQDEGGSENTSFLEWAWRHRFVVSVLHMASPTITNFKGISISSLSFGSPSTPVQSSVWVGRELWKFPFQEHGGWPREQGVVEAKGTLKTEKDPLAFRPHFHPQPGHPQKGGRTHQTHQQVLNFPKASCPPSFRAPASPSHQGVRRPSRQLGCAISSPDVAGTLTCGSCLCHHPGPMAFISPLSCILATFLFLSLTGPTEHLAAEDHESSSAMQCILCCATNREGLNLLGTH